MSKSSFTTPGFNWGFLCVYQSVQNDLTNNRLLIFTLDTYKQKHRVVNPVLNIRVLKVKCQCTDFEYRHVITQYCFLEPEITVETPRQCEVSRANKRSYGFCFMLHSFHLILTGLKNLISGLVSITSALAICFPILFISLRMENIVI